MNTKNGKETDVQEQLARASYRRKMSGTGCKPRNWQRPAQGGPPGIKYTMGSQESIYSNLHAIGNVRVED